jgi:hypothetical protein
LVTVMYFPLILSALVIVSAIFLLHQFLTGSLDDEAAMREPPVQLREDDAHDGLRAA